MTVGVQQNEVSRVIVGVMAILVVRLRRPARPLSRSAIRSVGNIQAAGLTTVSDVRLYEPLRVTRITSLCFTLLSTVHLHFTARHSCRLTEKMAAPSFVHLGLSCTGLHGRAICDWPFVSRPRLGVQYPSVARHSTSRRGGPA